MSKMLNVKNFNKNNEKVEEDLDEMEMEDESESI